jgi:hypothetical protein
MTLIVDVLAEEYVDLLSLEMQDGPWKCDAQALSMHGFVKMESMVLPEKVVAMLAKGQMTPNLRRLEITDKETGVDRKRADDFAGLGMEVLE